jgi:hypothetical protein
VPRVFISYRRSDTEMAAVRLREAIARRFGDQQTLRDKEDISAGLDWLNEIQRAIGSDAVVLALIGPAWLTASDSKGRRRIDNSEDANRVELEAAMSKGLRVVPVLVQGASMPDASELPDALRPLARRHALKLRDDDWNSDVQRLYSALEDAGLVAIGSTPSTDPVDPKGPPSRSWESVYHWTDRIVPPVFQPQTESEELVEKVSATALRGFAGVVQIGGRLLLTNQRVLFEVSSLDDRTWPFRIYNWLIHGRHFSSAAGPAMLSAPVAIPLSEIESVVPSMWGRITIRCRSGHKYRFDVARKKRKLIIAKMRRPASDFSIPNSG